MTAVRRPERSFLGVEPLDRDRRARRRRMRATRRRAGRRPCRSSSGCRRSGGGDGSVVPRARRPPPRRRCPRGRVGPSQGSGDPGPREQVLGQPEPAAAADDDGAAASGHQRRLVADAPVPDVERAVGDPGRRRVAGHEHGRSADVAHQVAQELVDDLRVGGVELGRRLVGDQQFAVRDGRADGDALLLSAREPARPRAAALREADALEQLVGPGQAGAPRLARQHQLQRDGLTGRQLARERARVPLVGVAEPPSPGGPRGAAAAAGRHRVRGRTRRPRAARGPRGDGAACSCRSRSGRGRPRLIGPHVRRQSLQGGGVALRRRVHAEHVPERDRDGRAHASSGIRPGSAAGSLRGLRPPSPRPPPRGRPRALRRRPASRPSARAAGLRRPLPPPTRPGR